MTTTTTTITETSHTTPPQLPIELQPIGIHALPPSPILPTELENQIAPKDAIEAENVKQKLPLLSSGVSFLVAGINDGSLGALVPYILATYGVSTSLISLIYLTTFLGWLLCALTTTSLMTRLPLGTLLLLGALLQIIPHLLRFWQPPFPLFCTTFFISALGQAYQDSHANTFVSAVKGAHRWLGFIHASYGLGLLISPFVATAVAVATSGHKSSLDEDEAGGGRMEGGRWMLFYLFPLFMSVLNALLVLIAFRDSVHLRKLASSAPSNSESENTKKPLRHLMRSPPLYIFSLFFFFYLGACTTSGGWIVEFLVRVRHGSLSEMGYVPSGFYGGVFLGRIVLAEPTHRWGEKRMLGAYLVVCFVLQMVFWLVPGLVGSVVVFSVLGFWLGPFFAAGISVASKIFPKHLQPAALGMIFVVAQAGGAIFPSLIGVIASHAGVKVLPPIVAALILVMGITWAFVPKVGTHRD